MSQQLSSQEPTPQYEIVKMEINGHPYYIKSKRGIPYLYDVDTHDEAGYWSSKKGQYIMFSLYNRIMKQKYGDCETKDDKEENDKIQTSDSTSNSSSQENVWSRSNSESSESNSQNETQSDSDSDDDESESESEPEPESAELSYDEETESKSEEEDEENQEQEVIVKGVTKSMNTYSLVFIFLVFFVYLTLQKEFQSIYFDFVFIILINLLNTLKVFEMLNEE